MKERFFTPWSLARVAEHVEWEEELVRAKDGTTNQQMFMAAIAILYERWMRGWSIPDFASAVDEAASGNFLSGLARILSSMEERVGQLLGFYQGLWWGANPRAINPWTGINQPAPEPASSYELAGRRMELFYLTIREYIMQLEGGNNERRGSPKREERHLR